MPKRSSSDPPDEDRRDKQERRPRDSSQLAYNVVREAVGDEEKFKPEKREKNPHAVALGRLGGKKGGKVRAEKPVRRPPQRDCSEGRFDALEEAVEGLGDALDSGRQPPYNIISRGGGLGGYRPDHDLALLFGGRDGQAKRQQDPDPSKPPGPLVAICETLVLSKIEEKERSKAQPCGCVDRLSIQGAVPRSPKAAVDAGLQVAAWGRISTVSLDALIVEPDDLISGHKLRPRHPVHLASLVSSSCQRLKRCCSTSSSLGTNGGSSGRPSRRSRVLLSA